MYLKTKKQSNQQGFTLIEVMVAVLIVAVALAGLSQTLAVMSHQQSSLAERVYATWLGQNRLIELQYGLGGEVEKTTESEMLGLVWQTQLEMESTAIPGMMRASLEVRLKDGKHPATRLVTVLGE
ncbi:type II secretion system minor pseudopilin GspI [Thiomicrospira microaerophila]|uniref:type II secretion system minor pseudopilin GspI n=1 Tax=Thiomicrospira microaerophila TaxID=406020 RepID=UPI00201032C9|nr:type II secretion system minor pseudopilin GspI [Thiomicrospira microaerophila]UQB41711.1 type II secretion system minor pseudopilin GspI [Thiomicrospira microaerophila]